METDKIILLVNKLAYKSSHGELDWEQTDKDGVYQLSFPNYSVRIMMKPTNIQDEYDYYINIYNQDGTLVERTVDYELKNYIENSYQTFKNIYENARRRAMGVDKALDDILNALDEDIKFPGQNNSETKEED